MTFDFSSLKDFCFTMDSDMGSDFKLDLVEKLFAITEPKTPFTSQVIIMQEILWILLRLHYSNAIKVRNY